MSDKTCTREGCSAPRTRGSIHCALHDAEWQRRRSGKPSGEAQLICPHCQSKGTVTSSQVKRKQGIHGGKATGAVLTGGISLLGTGLSRKNLVTERSCSACGSRWTVA